MKDILKTLIAHQTVSTDKEANSRALDYISNYLETRGMFVARYEWNGHGSLVATTKPTKSPRVMLAAHLDVVPAPPLAFKMTEENGRLYGAGICDMKFAIANYMQLVDDLQENLDTYDFGIMITTDEEIGGRDGVKKLLEDEGYRTEACVLPDGGNDWTLEVAARGVIWLTAIATGKSAHASQPWLGQNAIDKMMNFLQAMQRELFAEQGPDSSTCNIGAITGGTTANQVPNLCQVDIDIRPDSPADQKHILGRLQEIADEHDVSLNVHFSDSAIEIDLQNMYVATFVRHIESVRGEPLQTVRSCGASDARYFAAHNIPTLVIYPTGGERHGGREWIEEKSFGQFHAVLRGFVDDAAKAAIEAPELLTFAE